jgi:hypothetical protein
MINSKSLPTKINMNEIIMLWILKTNGYNIVYSGLNYLITTFTKKGIKWLRYIKNVK